MSTGVFRRRFDPVLYRRPQWLPTLPAIAGTGVLIADAATLSGSGASSSTGTGALAAQAATLIGAGLSLSTGTGRLGDSGARDFTWDASPEPDLAGYKIYRGTASGVYTTSVDVGNVTSYTWTDLPDGTLYFAIVAYDTSSNESDYSDEIVETIARTYADVTGAGLSLSTGTGALAAQAAAVDGAGAVGLAGSGTLAAQAATMAGAGLSGSTGTGAMAAQAATVDGAGVSGSTGADAIAAQAATLSGAGLSLSTGTGALVAQSAVLSGGSIGAVQTFKVVRARLRVSPRLSRKMKV